MDALLPLLDEAVIVKTFMDLKQGGTVRFNEMSEALFNWAKETINC